MCKHAVFGIGEQMHLKVKCISLHLYKKIKDLIIRSHVYLKKTDKIPMLKVKCDATSTTTAAIHSTLLWE